MRARISCGEEAAESQLSRSKTFLQTGPTGVNIRQQYGATQQTQQPAVAAHEATRGGRQQYNGNESWQSSDLCSYTLDSRAPGKQREQNSSIDRTPRGPSDPIANPPLTAKARGKRKECGDVAQGSRLGLPTSIDPLQSSPTASSRSNDPTELTPRGSSQEMNPLSIRMTDQAPPSFPSIPPPIGALAVSQPASSTTTSSSRTRSSSPTKKNKDLKLAKPPIVFMEFRTQEQNLTGQAMTLLRDLKRIGNSTGQVPACVRTEVMEYLVKVEKEHPEDVDQDFSHSTSRSNAPAQPDSSVFHHKVFDRIVEIRDAAVGCRKDAVSEPEWNEAVHYPLIKLALAGQWREPDVWFHNISKAQIRPNLLPSIESQSKRYGGKMVDYAMVIQPPEAMLERMEVRFRDKDEDSINHTDAEYLRFKPVTVSIETKRAAVGEDEAKDRLGT
ncbi:MAG: hypothetical protein Q9225_006150 [Loekoesia sp. 1 TL-2023]